MLALLLPESKSASSPQSRRTAPRLGSGGRSQLKGVPCWTVRKVGPSVSPAVAKLSLCGALQELDYLQQVWEITKEWEDHWNEWKTGSFKTLQTEVMETTAYGLFRKLNKLSRELKVRERLPWPDTARRSPCGVWEGLFGGRRLGNRGTCGTAEKGAFPSALHPAPADLSWRSLEGHCGIVLGGPIGPVQLQGPHFLASLDVVQRLTQSSPLGL